LIDVNSRLPEARPDLIRIKGPFEVGARLESSRLLQVRTWFSAVSIDRHAAGRRHRDDAPPADIPARSFWSWSIGPVVGAAGR
jgi:hypothetical protein